MREAKRSYLSICCDLILAVGAAADGGVGGGCMRGVGGVDSGYECFLVRPPSSG